MRCIIVALMTFLVVAAFNPVRTLLNPSPKLDFRDGCNNQIDGLKVRIYPVKKLLVLLFTT